MAKQRCESQTSVFAHFAVVGAVVLLHVGGLWALQSGLLHRVMARVVPGETLVEIIDLPKPLASPAQPVTSPAPVPAPRVRHLDAKPVRPESVKPIAPPAPVPVANAEWAPTAEAPTGAVEQGAPATPAPKVAAEPVPSALPATPAAPNVELPSSSADYLNNPPPAYPSMSRRLREQGTVVVRVLIGIDGTATKAELRRSSGFDRLDETALQTVARWRYVPGKRGGVPEAMWFNVPIDFVLD